VLDPTGQRQEELVEAGEGQLHLRLDAGDLGDATVTGAIDDVVEQGRLADASLAAQHENSTGLFAHRLQELVEDDLLASPATQRGRRLTCRHHQRSRR
jgi:hypothetical protein